MNNDTIVIVNADDFGMSNSINKAIISSFDAGLISSATIMSNMPGFEDAVQLQMENKLNGNVGIHLNLTEGEPLSDRIKNHSKFFNGKNPLKNSSSYHFLSSDEKNVIYHELQLQIDKCRSSGIHISHADSHHHIHHFWDVGSVVREVIKKNNIPALRLRFNWGDISPAKKIYSYFYNEKIRRDGLAKTKYFCEIRKVTKDLLLKKVPSEVMVHPQVNSNGILVNYENGKDLVSLKDKFLGNITMVPYSYLS